MNTFDPKSPSFKAPTNPRAGFDEKKSSVPTIVDRAKFVKKVAVPASATAYKASK